MKTLEDFIKLAKDNGYTSNNCNGWDWIRQNIAELDYIWQTDEYKAQKGMKYKCMPIILKGKELSQDDERVLLTAWYINNERTYKQERDTQIKKINDMGFYNIENKEEYNGKKIEFIVDNSDGLFGGWNKLKGKLFFSPTNKFLMAMPSRCTRRGYWVSDKVFVKFL